MPLTQASLDAEINSQLPSNNVKAISAAVLRPVLRDMAAYTAQGLTGFNPAEYGAVMDGLTDDSAAINACLTAKGLAWIPPNVSVGIGNQVFVTSNQSLIGSGPTSKLVPLDPFDGVNMIDYAGDNIVIKDFSIVSAQPDIGHESNHAFIQNSAAVTNFRAGGITVNSPTQRTGFLNIIVGTGMNVSDAVVENCNVITCDSGMTIFGLDTIGVASNVLITNNYIANTYYNSGDPGGSGISLSATIKNCVISNNIFGNHNYSCVELVGTLDGISVIGNSFFGTTTPRSVASSNIWDGIQVLIADNVCASDFAGQMQIGATPGVEICNNNIIGGLHLSSSDCWVHDNIFKTPVDTHSPIEYEGGGIFIDGRSSSCTGNLLENNIFDVTDSPDLSWALICNGATCTGNVIRNNVYKRNPQSFAYEDEINSATGNLFYGNQMELTGLNDGLLIIGSSDTAAGVGLFNNTYNDDFVNILQGLTPNLGTGNRAVINFGVANSSLDQYSLAFKYVGSGNTTNAFELFFYAAANPAFTVDTTGLCTTPGGLLARGTNGVGYATGAGGTVTQDSSRTTGVTLDKICGAITMFSAAGSTTAATFTVTNSTVAAADTIILNQKSGTNLYNFIVTAVADGSFNITFHTTGGTATDAPVINFAVIKAVTA